jgi:ribonuclease HI
MITDENFIEKGMYSFTLNKAQLKILGQSHPPVEGWESLIINKKITQDKANLFLLLRGKLALTAQEQIIKNYQLMLDFKDTNNIEEIKPQSIISDTLSIYCDGACLNNPGKSGSGLAIYADNNKPILLYGEYKELGTNNTAELNALYKALIIASESKASNITIFSDSQYSIDCITKWAYGWKSKAWTKKGGEIKNLEIIKISHELYDTIKNKITVKHVKGHSGIEGNELADRMAMMAITYINSEYMEYSYEDVTEVL